MKSELLQCDVVKVISVSNRRMLQQDKQRALTSLEATYEPYDMRDKWL